jgi:hypothetical protein
MNTAQLQCLLECALRDSCTKFLGVYAADRIPTRLQHYPCCLIANTDPHNRRGQHWVAMYAASPTRVEFFDSYGMPPEVYTSLRIRFAIPTYNTQSLQSFLSNVCGHYCVYFLCARVYHNASFSDVCLAPLRLHRRVRDSRMRVFVNALRSRIPCCRPCVLACRSSQCCRPKHRSTQ